MKAAFVAPNLNVGGLERQWSILVPGLVQRGVTTEVFTLDGKGRFFDEIAARGVPTDCLELHGRLNVIGAFGAARYIAARTPDVIVTAGVSAHVVGQLASYWCRSAHVAAIHSIPEHPGSFTLRRRAIVRVLAPHVTASTAVTSAQLGLLRTLGFDSNRTHVIPNGVARAETQQDRQTVRAEFGIPRDAFVALLIATLRPEKRVDRFVDAVEAAHTENPAIMGYVAGGGPGLDRLRELCARTASNVYALGPRADTEELIQAADVVCLTSDAEALPLTVLEAMAGARPVVATDVGGVRDAVVDGETGFLVPAGDIRAFWTALVKLADAPELAATLGEAGRRRHAERFTLERMVEAHYNLFLSLRPGDVNPSHSTNSARPTS